MHRVILRSAALGPTTDYSPCIVMTFPIRLCLLFLLWAGLTPASALDAMSIGDDLRVMRLAPYVQSTPEGHLAFAIQNASDEPIFLDLERLRPPLMGFALGLFREQEGLRLFVSDDSEFTARPGHPDRISFYIRAKAVQTFVLVNNPDATGLYLWNPNARQAFEDRRWTMQAVILAVLLALGAGGLSIAVFRRSSRAYYALVMGGGMLVLISSLWMRGLVASLGLQDAVLPYRLDYARGALIFMLVMTAISQVNMLLRKTTNRNYWTRVVIIGDFCLLAAGLSGLAAVWQPDFAGLISNDISEVLLAVTCACVFLGAIFVPDQRRLADEVPEQTNSDS